MCLPWSFASSLHLSPDQKEKPPLMLTRPLGEAGAVPSGASRPHIFSSCHQSVGRPPPSSPPHPSTATPDPALPGLRSREVGVGQQGSAKSSQHWAEWDVLDSSTFQGILPSPSTRGSTHGLSCLPGTGNQDLPRVSPSPPSGPFGAVLPSPSTPPGH